MAGHHAATPAELLLGRLEAVRQSSPGRWYARCPAHDDNRPSLAITEADDGRVLLFCMAGCSSIEISVAAGLELSDLFPRDGYDTRPMPRGARWDYRALLRMVGRECHVVVTAAHELSAGRPIDNRDRARLKQAAARISQTAELAR